MVRLPLCLSECLKVWLLFAAPEHEARGGIWDFILPLKAKVGGGSFLQTGVDVVVARFHHCYEVFLECLELFPLHRSPCFLSLLAI